MAAAGAIGKSIGATEASAKPEKRQNSSVFYSFLYKFTEQLGNLINSSKDFGGT